MESGTLSQWKVAEGFRFTAGDSLAEIQTDKASIDFEAQDDGFIAKYLIRPGTEVKIGDPIMVTVEEQEYAEAFKNYTFPEQPVVSAPAAAAKEEKEPKAASAAPPVSKLSAAVAVPSPSSLPPPPAAVAAPIVAAAAAAATTGAARTLAPSWGKLAKKTSPIAKTLGATQRKYIELYGSTGQSPL